MPTPTIPVTSPKTVAVKSTFVYDKYEIVTFTLRHANPSDPNSSVDCHCLLRPYATLDDGTKQYDPSGKDVSVNVHDIMKKMKTGEFTSFPATMQAMLTSILEVGKKHGKL